MSMLDRVADLNEERQPLTGRELIFVAVIVNPNPSHQFHDKVGSACFRRARIEDLRDVRMVHESTACRSASKRAMTLRVSMPSLMTFNATRRRTGCSCSAK